MPPESAALAVTVAQLGCAVGIFLLVPLGDRLPYARCSSPPRATGLALLAASTAVTLPPCARVFVRPT
ncbi:hypothetical protein ACWDKQ_17270 [Saccharopolyspora sp. NPDC000995]